MTITDVELTDQDRLASELVERLVPLGAPARAEIPITHVDAQGGLSLWKVTVERVDKLEFVAE